ncbi:MAG: hypothetical protein ACJ797_15840 [Ktedonobacteraceae bacterium]
MNVLTILRVMRNGHRDMHERQPRSLPVFGSPPHHVTQGDSELGNI